MSLTVKTLTWAVQLNHGTNAAPDLEDITDLCTSADVTFGIYQDNSTATVSLSSLPSGATPSTDVVISAGFDGSTDTLFYGPIFQRRRSLSGVQLNCRGRMAWLRHRWTKEDRTYDSTIPADTASSVIQNLVEASGIDVSLTSITTDDDWGVGTVIPVELLPGDTPLDLIRRIDEATPNYVTFECAGTSGGEIRRRKKALTSSVATYTQGTSLIAAERVEDVDAVRNAVKVRGLVYEGFPIEYDTSAASSYVPSAFEFLTHEINNPLIEDGPLTPPDGTSRAEIVGAGLLAALNRLGDTVELTVLGDGSLNPADTVTITASRLGLSGATRFVTAVRHHVGPGDFTTQLTVEAL